MNKNYAYLSVRGDKALIIIYVDPAFYGVKEAAEFLLCSDVYVVRPVRFAHAGELYCVVSASHVSGVGDFLHGTLYNKSDEVLDRVSQRLRIVDAAVMRDIWLHYDLTNGQDLSRL